jgi:hypothetical protein
MSCKLIEWMVPEAGLEPARAFRPWDFKSALGSMRWLRWDNTVDDLLRTERRFRRLLV